MRTFLGKIFVCLLLVPIVARGGGLLLEAALGDARTAFERVVGNVLPLYAQLAVASLQNGGPEALQAMIERAQAGTELRLSVRPITPAGCPAPGDAAVDRDGRRRIYTTTTSSADGVTYCVTASVPPRARILGVFPASLWALLPLLEFALCCVISFFLARYLARPIRAIRDAAAAFAAGDLEARAGGRIGRRRDEAADLVREFDRMAGRISGLIRAQQRFIGDVSHEIRSPLARLSMALGLARREAGPVAAEQFDRMEREVGTVSRLVRELLTLSTLQGRVGPGRTGPVELVGLVEAVVDDVTFEWHERAHGIRLLQSGPVVVEGDEMLLARVVENVLRNALFYTPDGTEVEAIVERTGAWARIVVRDHGPGVPPGALLHLFEPFYRVDEARARNTGGIGIGLAICKRAVELHGGRISAANSAPGGLAIRIELPALSEMALPTDRSTGNDACSSTVSIT